MSNEGVTVKLKTGHFEMNGHPIKIIAERLEDELKPKRGRPGMPFIIRLAIIADYERLKENEGITQAEFIEKCQNEYKIGISLSSFERYYREFRRAESGETLRILKAALK